MVETLDFRERGLEAVPLGLVLGTANGDGDGVFESAVVSPELELLEGRSASEELYVD